MADTEIHIGTTTVSEPTADQVTCATSHQRIEVVTVEAPQTNQNTTLQGVT